MRDFLTAVRRRIRCGSFHTVYQRYQDVAWWTDVDSGWDGFHTDLASIYAHGELWRAHYSTRHHGDLVGWFDVEYASGVWHVREFRVYCNRDFSEIGDDWSPFVTRDLAAHIADLPAVNDPERFATVVSALLRAFVLEEVPLKGGDALKVVGGWRK